MQVVYYFILGAGLIGFAVNFCCPYQCKWLPGGPSPKWPVICHSLLFCFIFLLSKSQKCI